jgi:hypothetical protein
MDHQLLGVMSVDVTFSFAQNAVSSSAFFLSKQWILGDNGRCFSNDGKLPCHHATSSCAPSIKPHMLNRNKRDNRKYSKAWKKSDHHYDEMSFISYLNHCSLLEWGGGNHRPVERQEIIQHGFPSIGGYSSTLSSQKAPSLLPPCLYLARVI